MERIEAREASLRERMKRLTATRDKSAGGLRERMERLTTERRGLPAPAPAPDRRTFGLGPAESHRPSHREPGAPTNVLERLGRAKEATERKALIVGQQMTRAMTEAVGLPVDAATAAVNLAFRGLGLPPVQEPVGGSEWLVSAAEMPQRLVGQEWIEPETRAEKILAAGAEAAGRALPYSVGAIGAAARLATSATVPATGKAALTREAARRVVGTPEQAVAIEAGIVPMAAAGRASAEAAAPGNEIAGMVGEIAGGLLGGVGAGMAAMRRFPLKEEALLARPKGVRAKLRKIIDESDQGLIGKGEAVSGPTGARSSIKTVRGEYPVEFKVVEADTLVASHDPWTFKPHPQYPKGVQERDYLRDKRAQIAVRTNEAQYDPRFTITQVPGPEHGPPIVGPDGIIYGGNSRYMSTARLYKTDRGSLYKDDLVEYADRFGLKPEQVRGMKEPILVRELAEPPKNTGEAAALASDLNRPFTRALSEQEQAVAAGRRLSPETLEYVSSRLQALGDRATLRELMRAKPKEILDRLRTDGILTEVEMTKFLDPRTDDLNVAGRTFLQNAVFGSVIEDANLLATAPKGILNKAEAALAPLIRLRARGGEWDLSDHIRDALRIHTNAKAADKTLAQMFDPRVQGFWEKDRVHPVAMALARKLQGTQKAFKAALGGAADDAVSHVERGTLGFHALATPEESLAQHLGVKWPKPPGPPEPPTPSGTAYVREGVLPPNAKMVPHDGAPIPPSARTESPRAPILDEVEHITGAVNKEPPRRMGERMRDLWTLLQTHFTTKYAPLRRMERELFKMRGKDRPRLDIARDFELLPGASGMAHRDIILFERDVRRPLMHREWLLFRRGAPSPRAEGGRLAQVEKITGAAAKRRFTLLEDFDSWITLRRIETRLRQDPKGKRVSNWTVEKAEAGLAELRQKVGDETFGLFENLGVKLQEHLDAGLRLQLETGRISSKMYEAMKEENPFYAPFRLLKYLEEAQAGTGRPIATLAQLTKRIRGIDAEFFEIRSPVEESSRYLYRARLLAEKQRKMNRLHDLSRLDPEGLFIRKLRAERRYLIHHRPAEEILHQLHLQATARNPQVLDVSLTKVGKAIRFAREAGLKVTKRMMATALGRAELGGASFDGKVFLNAFTSEVIAHELGHSFDTPIVNAAGNIIKDTKKVFGIERDIIRRLSSAINDPDAHFAIEGKKLKPGQRTVYQQELKALTDFTGLGGSSKYKARAVERFAEFVNLYIHDPLQARHLAPEFTKHFQRYLLPNHKIKHLIEKLSGFFQKIDGLPNVYSPLKQMDDRNYLELAIRTAFPDKRPQLGLVPAQRPRKGFEVVPHLHKGNPVLLEVSPEVARAVSGEPPVRSALIQGSLMAASTTLKMGATALNLPFQLTNVFRDQARLALVSQYGAKLKRPDLLVRYPIHVLQAAYASIAANNFKHYNQLYLDALASGTLNSTMQRWFTPSVWDPTIAKSVVRETLETWPKFSGALEETTKLTGFARARAFENLDKLPFDARQAKLKEIAVELRNFGGSPDFWRAGMAAGGFVGLNLLLMFYNARVQGATSDVTRLLGRVEGGGRAAVSAWLRLGSIVGIPSLALYTYIYGNKEERAHYDKVHSWEKENYFMLPKFDRYLRPVFFANDQGERVRDYWRIRKSEALGIVGNMVEAGVKFVADRDPKAFLWFAGELVEELSPVWIEGETLAERGESALSSLNPALKLPSEMATGREFFRKRDIIPQYISGVAAKDLPPEEQYHHYTPELYKKAGKKLGISPLRLEHAVRSVTAGGVEQLFPRKAPGREGILEKPLIGRALARWHRSPGVAAEEGFAERIQRALVEQGGERIAVNRPAEDFVRTLRELPIHEREQSLVALHERVPEVAERALRILDNEMRGITWEMRQVQQLGVENGARARFIAEEVRRLGPERGEEWVLALREAKMLSPKLWEQVRGLL